MNKLVKGSIAGAAGIALLLGGAGTLALWNDTTGIDDVAVSAGNLTLESDPAAAWDSPAIAEWVPGDTFTYTDNLTIVATGDNIEATLSVDETSISGHAELKSVLDFSLTADISAYASGIAADPINGTYEISAPGTYNVPVTVTVTFNELSDNTTQNQDVDLANLAFKLVQHL